MICPKCGAIVNESDNFCEECGISLKKINKPDAECNSHNEPIDAEVIKVDQNLAAVSSTGRRRGKNEDSAAVMRSSDGSVILVVSDGVSSAVNAVSASKLAVDKIIEVLSNRKGSSTGLIEDALYEANEVVLKLPYETKKDGIYGPEATIVSALICGDIALIGWVGDSRAYIIGRDYQKLLTVDDSWVELVVASGEMTRDEALSDRRAHYVTQVLGMHDMAVKVHVLEQKIGKGEMLLLCTDGVWNYFPGDNDLQKAISNFGSDKDCASICSHVVNLSNEAGGRDNITAAIFKNC